MTATTDFVAELVRAANEIDQLQSAERRRLLTRSIHTIRDMREYLGIPSVGNDADALLDLGATASAVDTTSDEKARAALLEAASMIRDLRIVLDSKIELIIKSVRDQDGPT